MPIVLKSGSLNLLESSGPVQACNGIDSTTSSSRSSSSGGGGISSSGSSLVVVVVVVVVLVVASQCTVNSVCFTQSRRLASYVICRHAVVGFKHVSSYQTVLGKRMQDVFFT